MPAVSECLNIEQLDHRFQNSPRETHLHEKIGFQETNFFGGVVEWGVEDGEGRGGAGSSGQAPRYNESAMIENAS